MKKKSIHRIIVLTCLCLSTLGSLAQLSGTYKIGPPPSDFPNIESAIIAVYLDGLYNTVTFEIKPGEYEERLYIPFIAGTAISKNIVFQSQDGNSDGVIIHYKPRPDSANYTIFFDYTQHVFFKNLTISTDTQTGRLVELGAGVYNVQFENVKFKGFSKGAELVYGACSSGYARRYVFFKNCSFYDGSNAIFLCGESTTPDQNLFVTNCKFYNQSARATYLGLQSDADYSGNVIFNSRNDSDLVGAIFDACTGNLSIQGNRFNLPNLRGNSYGMRIYRFKSQTGGQALIANNFMHLRTVDWCIPMDFMLSENVKILHNSINLTGNSSGSACISIMGGKDYLIQNNILANHALGDVMLLSPPQNLSSNYNNLYSNGLFLVYHGSTDYPNLAAWQTATSNDTNSISIEPAFCSDSNLHTFNPLLEGKAQYISLVKKDFDGESRSTTKPDLGADEFSAITLDIGADTVLCAGNSVTFTAQNGFDKYLWQDSSTLKSIQIVSAQNKEEIIKVRIKSVIKGCIFTDSATVTFHENPVVKLPEDTSLCLNFSENLLLSAGKGFDTYLWSSGDTSESFLADTTGLWGKPKKKTYWVLVSKNGCYGADTMYIDWIKCGNTTEENQHKVAIFPNPSFGSFQISGNGFQSISIYNVFGEKVYSRSHIIPASVLVIDLSNQPRGVYLVEMSDGGRCFSQKILVE